MKKIQGFTLIELMVTIAVLAIIAMMAAPTFGDMLDKQNLNRSTQDLIATIRDARAKAVIDRKEVKVLIDKPPISDPNTEFLWEPSGKAELVSTLDEISFAFNGSVKDAPTNSDGDRQDISFEICNKAGGSKSKIVRVSPMGVIQQVMDGDCT